MSSNNCLTVTLGNGTTRVSTVDYGDASGIAFTNSTHIPVGDIDSSLEGQKLDDIEAYLVIKTNNQNKLYLC